MKRNYLVNIGLLSALLSVNFLLVMPVLAKSTVLEKDDFVDRIIHAYGGEKLSTLKSLKVDDRYKVFSMDQGANPEINSVSILYSTLAVDFSSGKKSVKNWRQNANGNRLSQILYDGETGWNINHLRGTHIENKNLTANVVGAGMMRMIDTILAWRLEKHRDTATLMTHGAIGEEPIYTLSFSAGENEQYFLDVDAASGLILKMSKNSDRTTGPVYEFGKHKAVQGLTIATDINMLVNGKSRFITTSRSIEVNQTDQKLLSIPEDSIRLKGFIDRSKMSVQKLADKVYLAGKGANFSIFVDAGEFYIGGGGLSGIKKRLEAVNKFVGANKPIKIQVIPDHHRGHLGAIKELKEMGSSIAIASEHRPIIENLASTKDQNNDFIISDDKMSLANGLVEVYNINTVHAENYLLFYIPAAKLVFSADHFGSTMIDALPGANNTIKTFHSAIEKLAIEVEIYADSHSPALLSAENLKEVLTGYLVKPCPLSHDICRG